MFLLAHRKRGFKSAKETFNCKDTRQEYGKNKTSLLALHVINNIDVSN
jgi:hypothetical protein